MPNEPVTPADVAGLVERLLRRSVTFNTGSKVNPAAIGTLGYYSEHDARLDQQTAAALESLSAENKRLRKALEPFAEAAKCLDDDHKDVVVIWESHAATCIDAGDLRAARRALEGGE